MLDAAFLDSRLDMPAAAEQPANDSRVHQVSQLADRGDYLEAAAMAEELLHEQIYDIRVFGYYLFGTFVERGTSALPAMLRRLHTLLAEELDAIGPAKRKQQNIDTTLVWLLRTMVDRCRYHETQRDQTWSDWVASSTPDTVSESIAAIKTLYPAIEAAIVMASGGKIEEPRCLPQLGRLERWLGEVLRPAARRTEAPAGQAAQAGAGIEPAPDAAAPAAAPAPEPPAAPASAPSRAPAADESPALVALRQKLRAFELLMERGDFGKAAVVAHDIRGIIASFDPVLYFPRLFSTYFKLLSRAIDELMPYWEEGESPQWQALEQFYRADLEGFLAD